MLQVRKRLSMMSRRLRFEDNARVSFLEDKLDEGLLYLRVDVIAHLYHL